MEGLTVKKPRASRKGIKTGVRKGTVVSTTTSKGQANELAEGVRMGGHTATIRKKITYEVVAGNKYKKKAKK